MNNTNTHTHTEAGFTIEFNGSKTYFVSSEFDCIGTFSTLRKAKNFLSRVIAENKPA